MIAGHKFDRIRQLRACILVHSHAYYCRGESWASDSLWDSWAQELKQLQLVYPGDIGFFDDAYRNWEGVTGYHLPLQDPWVIHKVRQLKAKEKKT